MKTILSIVFFLFAAASYGAETISLSIDLNKSGKSHQYTAVVNTGVVGKLYEYDEGNNVVSEMSILATTDSKTGPSAASNAIKVNLTYSEYGGKGEEYVLSVIPGRKGTMSVDAASELSVVASIVEAGVEAASSNMCSDGLSGALMSSQASLLPNPTVAATVNCCATRCAGSTQTLRCCNVVFCCNCGACCTVGNN